MGLDAPFPFKAAQEDHRRVRESEWLTDLSIRVDMTERFVIKGVQIYNPDPSCCNCRLSLLLLAQEERIKNPDHFSDTTLFLLYGCASFIHSCIQESCGERKINEIRC